MLQWWLQTLTTLKLVSLSPHTWLNYINPQHALQALQRQYDLAPLLRTVMCTRHRKYKHVRQLARWLQVGGWRAGWALARLDGLERNYDADAKVTARSTEEGCMPTILESKFDSLTNQAMNV